MYLEFFKANPLWFFFCVSWRDHRKGKEVDLWIRIISDSSYPSGKPDGHKSMCRSKWRSLTAGQERKQPKTHWMWVDRGPACLSLTGWLTPFCPLQVSPYCPLINMWVFISHPSLGGVSGCLVYESLITPHLSSFPSTVALCGKVLQPSSQPSGALSTGESW